MSTGMALVVALSAFACGLNTFAAVFFAIHGKRWWDSAFFAAASAVGSVLLIAGAA